MPKPIHQNAPSIVDTDAAPKRSRTKTSRAVISDATAREHLASATEESPSPKPRRTKTATASGTGDTPTGKLGQIATLLRRAKGATLADLMKATGWQIHSVRGAMSGGLKKRFGLTITSEKRGETRFYKIAAAD